MDTMPAASSRDFDDADRGFIAALQPSVIPTADGRVAWDADAYTFLDEECPDTAHPSLWRQSRLCARSGLFEVCPGVYQVRGLDISNMTLVEGGTGVTVIDPLISVECAAAGLRLYRDHRGERPVRAVVYTHSHIDHFGGVAGVADGSVPIIAPVGFMDAAVSENVYAGTAMNRRASYMYAVRVPPGPAGAIGVGLGLATSAGTVSLLPPTLDVTHTGQEERVDGMRVVFQLTPGTEAPAEMNLYFPDLRALCMAENATHTMHNLLTLRGAVVRDAHAWARHLSETIALYADRTDVLFASHHWPTWGSSEVARFLNMQRDLYAYIHDQTLRLINQGLTATEIAEVLELPPQLAQAWHARGYYGSLSHNVKAVYQRYLGWFDGNPANLWQHPPQESARRYVECLGGPEAVLAHARRYADAGDLRFAAQLLQHAIFADPAASEARTALAAVYTRLGHGAENGTWRNVYLTGAQELIHGVTPSAGVPGAGMLSALSVEQLLDAVAIRVNGPRAAEEFLSIDWQFTDAGRRVRTTLRNGVLVQVPDPADRADLTLTLTRQGLLDLLAGRGTASIERTGNPEPLDRLLAVLDEPDPAFAIVTP